MKTRYDFFRLLSTILIAYLVQSFQIAQSAVSANLENPAPQSYQSGITVISGWICSANRVDIEIDGNLTMQASYGTVRLDTQSVCNDTNNGFGLLYNMNRLSNGVHSLRAIADGVEIGRTQFTVTTLGHEFLEEIPGPYQSYWLGSFPAPGQRVLITWQKSLQNFTVARVEQTQTTSLPAVVSAKQLDPDQYTKANAIPQSILGNLENPAPQSSQSGITIISGWVCNANRIDIEIDGNLTMQASYGTVRLDTQSVCNDTNNGFGLLYNMNRLGDGPHNLRVLVDGAEFARTTFNVTTLGLGDEFPRGLSGSYTLSDFPDSGQKTTVRWQESQQNFAISGYTGSAGQSAVGEFVSDSAGGLVSTSAGHQLAIPPGAIPSRADGSPATVNFSIESGVPLPAPLPSGFSQLGSTTKFGPDGFNFAWPLATALPLPEGNTLFSSPSSMRYDAGQNQWVRQPGVSYNLGPNDQLLSAIDAPYNLGYATLALLNASTAIAETAEYQGYDGAFRWITNSCPQGTNAIQPCSYYFVVTSFVAKYPDQQFPINPDYPPIFRTGWDSTGRPAGNSAGSLNPSTPASSTLFHLTQGQWTFCITASEYVIPGGTLPLPGKWVYSKPITVNINAQSTYDQVRGWSNIFRLPESEIRLDAANWHEPSAERVCPNPANPNPTRPVGTGDFQATLTWVNTESSMADVDLHLEGPNGIHVYYGETKSPDGSLELDRDWMYGLGNAVENIYSLGPMPSGEYKLYVMLYRGEPKNYSVRVLQQGQVQTYSGRLEATGQKHDIVRFNR